jgi:hypothetical protein
MALEIQVLAWDRHKYEVVLNQFMIPPPPSFIHLIIYTIKANRNNNIKKNFF